MINHWLQQKERHDLQQTLDLLAVQNDLLQEQNDLLAELLYDIITVVRGEHELS